MRVSKQLIISKSTAENYPNLNDDSTMNMMQPSIFESKNGAAKLTPWLSCVK